MNAREKRKMHARLRQHEPDWFEKLDDQEFLEHVQRGDRIAALLGALSGLIIGIVLWYGIG